MIPQWMVDDDFTILNWFLEHDMVSTPKILTYELDLSYAQINKRLTTLREHGLLESPEEAPKGISTSGVYRMTDLGRKVATGDISLKELSDLK